MTDLSDLPVGARISEFVDLYQRLREASGEDILARRNFRLKDVHPFANALTIVDMSTPNFWLVRLSGTKACERVGCDKTGSNAKKSFSEDEQELRSYLAHSLFENPCGIRALTREIYSNGEQSLLDTITLPLFGKENKRLVVHYAQVVEDIEHGYGKRSLAEKTQIASYEFVDLGHGTPADVDMKLSA